MRNNSKGVSGSSSYDTGYSDQPDGGAAQSRYDEEAEAENKLEEQISDFFTDAYDELMEGHEGDTYYESLVENALENWSDDLYMEPNVFNALDLHGQNPI